MKRYRELEQLYLNPGALNCADTRPQQNKGVVIHTLGGNVDVRAWLWGKVVEGEVNAFLPGLLPLAARTSFGGDDRLRFGHGEDKSYTLSRAKVKIPNCY